MWIAEDWRTFEVLDCGDGEKLERWGDVVLRRPDPQAIWPKWRPELWERADAWYHRSDRGGGAWERSTALPERWTLAYGGLRFYVRPTGFKHTGLFPEQASNWDWMRGLIRRRSAQSGGSATVKVLNLFAYTGAATAACAEAGATVCHVDAAKGMSQWARENCALNHIDPSRTRWIVDDALKFVGREARRGSLYDGILMDPPSYGRGPGGEVWKLEDALYELVAACADALCQRPLFFLINSYTTGLAASVLWNMLERVVTPRFGGRAEAEELGLPVTAGGVLPCGASGRMTFDG
jgi:23S rRNA (cytosine1962-C5)-methyltransferase